MRNAGKTAQSLLYMYTPYMALGNTHSVLVNRDTVAREVTAMHAPSRPTVPTSALSGVCKNNGKY